jgi:hypothetical protein
MLIQNECKVTRKSKMSTEGNMENSILNFHRWYTTKLDNKRTFVHFPKIISFPTSGNHLWIRHIWTQSLEFSKDTWNEFYNHMKILKQPWTYFEAWKTWLSKPKKFLFVLWILYTTCIENLHMHSYTSTPA